MAQRDNSPSHGIRGVAPLGNARIRSLLPRYTFRLRVVPKGSFFSILPKCTEMHDGPIVEPAIATHCETIGYGKESNLSRDHLSAATEIAGDGENHDRQRGGRGQPTTGADGQQSNHRGNSHQGQTGKEEALACRLAGSALAKPRRAGAQQPKSLDDSPDA